MSRCAACRIAEGDCKLFICTFYMLKTRSLVIVPHILSHNSFSSHNATLSFYLAYTVSSILRPTIPAQSISNNVCPH